MARLKDLLKMTGTLAMITMYTRQGSDEVYIRTKGGPSKKQIKTNPEFAKVRLNNSEWVGCTKMGSKIRSAFYTMNILEDYPVNGALNAICKHIQHLNIENELGKRSVALSKHKEMMVGFSFSQKQVLESVLRVPISTTLDRGTGVARVDIPAINTEINLYNFRGLPYFRILGALGGASDRIYSEEDGKYVELNEGYCSRKDGIYQSEWLPSFGTLPAMSFTLSYPLVENPIPDDVTLLLSVGIEFGKMSYTGQPVGVKYAGTGKVMRVG